MFFSKKANLIMYFFNRVSARFRGHVFGPYQQDMLHSKPPGKV
jgi:hypothetical protein